jgi:hypothetical protein
MKYAWISHAWPCPSPKRGKIGIFEEIFTLVPPHLTYFSSFCAEPGGRLLSPTYEPMAMAEYYIGIGLAHQIKIK